MPGRDGRHPRPRRRSGSDADLRSTLAAGVALTAYQTALHRWVDSGGTKAMDELVDQPSQ
ncbi:hypothetical protein ACWD0J_07800 [Streptomyces sp. NPDC003011]